MCRDRDAATAEAMRLDGRDQPPFAIGVERKPGNPAPALPQSFSPGDRKRSLAESGGRFDHDEPFALYRQSESKGKYNQDRFNALLQAIRDWNLFLAFNIIDGCTAGKSRDKLHWLFREVAGQVESKFTAADIIS